MQVVPCSLSLSALSLSCSVCPSPLFSPCLSLSLLSCPVSLLPLLLRLSASLCCPALPAALPAARRAALGRIYRPLSNIISPENPFSASLLAEQILKQSRIQSRRGLR